jgi:membrane-associated protein
VLRALVPGLAGTSGMSARSFTLMNLLGGATWGVTVAVLGYGAGAAYPAVLASLGRAGQVGLGAVALLVVGLLLVRRLPRRRAGGDATRAADQLERVG